jgi:DNA-binding NarL/FixJ family response regulator
MLAEGRTNREIGNESGLAEITFKKHVQSVVNKLGAADRTQAASIALRYGLIK